MLRKKNEALNQLPLKHQAVSHFFYLFIFLDMYCVGLIYTKENTLLWLVATYLFQLMYRITAKRTMVINHLMLSATS